MYGNLVRAASLTALLAAPAVHAQQTVRLPREDRPLPVRAAEVYSVGKAEGSDWEMFTRVDQVGFDGSDNLYVLDGGANRVLVFDRSGRFVRQVGRKGGGPGELMMPLGFAVLADGTLAVADLGQRSYALFAADGKYLRSVPFAEEWMPVPRSGGIVAHPRGGVAGPVRQMPQMVLNGAARTTAARSTPILWQPFAAGAQAVRLFEAPSDESTRTRASEPRSGERRVTTSVGAPTFSPRLNWGMVQGGGMVVSHTSGYTLRVLDAGGKVVRYVQKPMPVRKVTERDRQRERDRRRESLRTGEGMRVVTMGGNGGPSPRSLFSKEQVEEMVQGMEFAETIPAIQNLRVDGAGRLWVERTGAAWGDPGPIDLVTAEGRYLGTLTGQSLPASFSASGRAAYVETDADGVARVVVRQLSGL